MTLARSKPFRGSDKKCPKCGSTKINVAPELRFQGYGPGLASCVNCKALWEYFTEDMIWDKDDPLCSFSKPCNNCAFRKGSPEQQDPAKWAELLEKVAHWGSSFYCHKGVPIESDAEHGFAYPTKREKLRFCRGYLGFFFSGKAEELRKRPESEGTT